MCALRKGLQIRTDFPRYTFHYLCKICCSTLKGLQGQILPRNISPSRYAFVPESVSGFRLLLPAYAMYPDAPLFRRVSAGIGSDALDIPSAM